MISEKTVNVYGIVSVILMAGMLALMAFKMVSREWFIPMFVAAAILYAGRFILRMVLVRQKHAAESDEFPKDPPPTAE